MSDLVHNEDLLQIASFISLKTGFSFKESNLAELANNLLSAYQSSACSSFNQYKTFILEDNNPQLLEDIISRLTIGETYFFRHYPHFQILKEIILPSIIDKKKGVSKIIRLWSAGCATGEEAFSIAIILKELSYELKDWTISVLATDINSSFLEKAKAGIFSDWAFREEKAGWIKDCYFKKNDNKYIIANEIKELVSFNYLNLIDDAYPSIDNNTYLIDVIFCRNVTIYFDEATNRKIAKKLCASLVEGGYLVPGPSDSLQSFYELLIPYKLLSNTIIFKKESARKVRKEPTLPKQHTTIERISFPSARHEKLVPVKPRVVAEDDLSALGLSSYKKRNFQQSFSFFADKIGKNPDDYFSAYMAAKCLANLGKFAEALDWCNRALSVNKTFAEVYYLTGLILKEEKKFDQSVSFIKKALFLDKNFIMAHFALANLYLKKKSSNQALKSFSNTRELLLKEDGNTILKGSDDCRASRLLEQVTTAINTLEKQENEK